MILHELCHGLVEGPDSFALQDWGLDNTTEADDYREHATLRVQAVLTGRYGLRDVLGPTTDFRHYYDTLDLDALRPRSETSSQLAITALRRAGTNPWWPHLEKALEATRRIIEVAADWPAPADAPSIYRNIQPRLPTHDSGLIGRHPTQTETCGDCAWRDDKGYCQQASKQVASALPACERYETAFDCQDCGACCRAAYHSVTISEGDAIADKHPSLLVFHDTYTELKRAGDHCAALESQDDRHSCTIYQDRPTCCREFENAGQNCLIARRRLGYSL